MGIPLELLSMLGSALFSGLMSLWSMKIKGRLAEHKALMAKATRQAKNTDAARNYKGNFHFQFTRRIIALSCIFAIIVLPKVMGLLAPIYGWDVDITYGWTHVETGFWWWSDDVTKLTWETAKGMVITPLDTHIVSSIIGLYFGASVVRNA